MDSIKSQVHERPLSHIPFTYELDNSTTTGSSCPNSDFSQGDFTNWTGHYGTFANPSQTLGFWTIPPNERHLIIAAPGTTDPYGTNVSGPETLNTVFPGEAFSARLGNSATGGQAEQLSYDITIGPNSDFFIYRYAVVLNHNSDHTPAQRASFEINIIDKATGQQYDPVCGYYYVYAQPNLPGWYTSPLTGGSNNLPVYWKNWTTVGLGFDVSDYGKTLTIVFTTKDCSPGGHFGYAYISAFCSSLSVSFQGCEGSNTVTMTGPPGFADYEWTGPYCPTCTPVIVGTAPSITITNAATGDEYRLRLVSFYNYPNCVIQKVTSTVAFTQMNAEFTSSINCIGNPSTFTDVSVINQNATNDRIWDFGDGSPPVTLTTVTATHVYATAGSYDVKLKRATTDPCQDSIIHTIVVATLPPEITNLPMSKSICSGQAVSLSLDFSQVSANATWTRTVTSGTATITNNPASQSGTLIDDLIVNNTAADAVVTYTLTPKIGNCIGLPAPYIVTVHPVPSVNPIVNQTYCNNISTPATLVTSPVGAGTTFSWTSTNTAIGLAASGTGDIPAFTATNTGVSPISSSITITPAANGCSGMPLTFTITVNPTPTVSLIPDQAWCNAIGVPVTAVSSPVGGGATFTWTNTNTAIGLAANGTGDIPAYTAANGGTVPISGSITIIPTANACIGTPLTYTVAVNPTPTVIPIPNQTFCNSVAAPLTPVSSLVGPGATFTWTNDNPAIGLTATGTGDIPAFSATNAGIVPISGTITIIPTANACIGTPLSYSITVNPTPTVNPIFNQSYCNGIGTPETTVSSPVGAGTTFAWSNSNPAIGLSASGTGNIPAFTATNSGITTITATISITPTANACSGTPLNYTITVYPTPIVNPITSQVYCNSTGAPSTLITSPVGAGTTFSWTNSNPTIGLAAVGTGNIPGFTATNMGITPVGATIEITPSANACIGIPLNYTITVNPSPTVNPITSQTYCNGLGAPLTVISSPVGAGTTFTWTNNNTSIGLAASGLGNIPGFTAANTTIAPISAIISIIPTANACVGPLLTYTIIVNPTPHLMNSQPATICSGTTLNIPFLQDVAGSAYTWSASCIPAGTVGGITAIQSTGTNAITDMLTNTGNVVSTVTYLITPRANGCAGPAAGLNVPVNPTPVISCAPGQSICSGTAFTPVILNSTVAGTDYSWSAVCPVGSVNPCPVAPGIANPITPVTFFNTTDIQQTTTYTITSAFQGCPGTSATHVVTVNPSPTVTNWPLEQTICSGQTSALINLTSTVTGTTFSWTASTISPITGFSLNGTSQVPAQTLTIPPGNSGFVTYHIIPSFTGGTSCPGAPTDYKINVNQLPVPVINGLVMVCELQSGVTYSTPNVPGHSYNWNISGATFILGANTNSVTLTWGAYALSPGTLTVTETIDATGCFQTTAAYQVTILQRPVPSLTGPLAVCDVSAGNVYQTETGMTNYTWTIAGGSITAGGGTGSASSTVYWNTPGSRWIEVNYINAMGCPGFPSKKLPVTVHSLPNTTITEGSGPNCEARSHDYQTPPDPACSYTWIIAPAGRGLVSSGQGLSNVTIDWLTSGPATIQVTATNGTTACNSTGTYPIIIHPKPNPVFDVPCFDLITTQTSKKFILRGASPFLSGQGIYSGNRVSLNGVTGNYEFDPFGATPGNYPVTYTFTNNFGCPASTAPVSITVASNFFNCGGDLTDIRDGKKYKTAMLSGRCWMKENLNYGSMLSSPSGPVQTDNCLPEKYCAPADVGCTKFGGMYQWDELMDYATTPGSKGICPPEWHVPTETEWQSLIDNVLSGVGAPVANALAGSTLKDAVVTGSFFALLCGLDYNNNIWAFTNGSNTGTQFWTSTACNGTHAMARGLNIYTPSVSRYPGSRGNAFSLRCVKD